MRNEPHRGAREGDASHVGTPERKLPPQSIKRGGRCEVAGAVIEQLAWQRAGHRVIVFRLRFEPPDAGRDLDDAVESSTRRPWTCVAPSCKLHDDESGIALDDAGRRETKRIECA